MFHRGSTRNIFAADLTGKVGSAFFLLYWPFATKAANIHCDGGDYSA